MTGTLVVTMNRDQRQEANRIRARRYRNRRRMEAILRERRWLQERRANMDEEQREQERLRVQ